MRDNNNILIVDDQPDNLQLLQTLLGEYGFVTRVATSGSRALTSIQFNPPDLILLDVKLPDIDGYHVAEKLKNDLKTADIPIIFISGLLEPNYKIQAFAAGGVDYITKPFANEEVLARVNTHLQISCLQRELKHINEVLEARVQERTIELARINEELRQEIGEHQEARRRIDLLNQELERKVELRTAELVAANQELESFSYSVSHDLRAPLRTASWHLDAVMQVDKTRNGDCQPSLMSIRHCIDKMYQLIDALLKFSLALRQDQRIGIFELAAEVKSIFMDLASAEPERKIELIIYDMPPAQGDLTLLRQVLQNLLSNALKFTRNREHPIIEVGSITAEKPGENVYYIRDNGDGFDSQYKDRLFKVFQRLHGEQQFEGIGVGLALCARVIERHSGRIWAESEPNQGATFYFSLPAVENAALLSER